LYDKIAPLLFSPVLETTGLLETKQVSLNVCKYRKQILAGTYGIMYPSKKKKKKCISSAIQKAKVKIKLSIFHAYISLIDKVPF
jgi:hypothetical protein